MTANELNDKTLAQRDHAAAGQDREYAMLGLRIIGEFGAIIAVPIVALAVLGKWLDGTYGTAPMFLIGGFVVAFALSAHMIYRKAKRFNDEYQALGRKEDAAKAENTAPKADMEQH